MYDVRFTSRRRFGRSSMGEERLELVSQKPPVPPFDCCNGIGAADQSVVPWLALGYLQ
jgi:hypothetical protein